jgi:hypothetical protein
VEFKLALGIAVEDGIPPRRPLMQKEPDAKTDAGREDGDHPQDCQYVVRHDGISS